RGNGDVYVATYSTQSIYVYRGGDPAQRTVLASFSGNSGNPSLQFGPDQTKLYYTSVLTGNLIEVDADDGSSTEVIAKGGLVTPISIAIFGSGHTAKWSNYGTGLAGTHGVPFF